MILRDETIFLIEKYKLKANKKLGQNFLISDEVLEKIIDVSDVSENDIVIEIGPGLGSLTAKLLERAKKVIAIELDDNMINVLNERFSLYKNIDIIKADVLKINLQELIEKEEGNFNVKVVANLPYYITTPIIMKLLEEELPIDTITVMVQKQVGERFCANLGNKSYGAITVSIKYYAEAEYLFDVHKDCFIPVPEVDSCVIKLKTRAHKINVKDKKIFFNTIKSAFLQRRKNISNSLSNLMSSKSDVIYMLGDLEIDLNKRAENLSIEDFAKIADYIANKNKD